MLDNKIINNPKNTPLISITNPQSNSLNNWHNETNLSFTKVTQRFSNAICETKEHVATMLVHDVNLAHPALEAKCTNLIVNKHMHVKISPNQIKNTNSRVNYSFTTSTTSNATYAIAISSKPRRDAIVSLITYRDGRPVRIQPVTLQTNGTFLVKEYVELELDEE